MVHAGDGGAPAIDVAGVHKRYGSRSALGGVDLRVERGEIVGFIGPNGSGKSSLMRIIAGLARATEGSVHVLGECVDGSSSPPGIGLVLEQQGHLPHLSAARNLRMLGSLTRHGDQRSVEAVLRRVGLDPADRRPVGRWSFGMRQRLLVAQALLDEPRVLLLDEPTNGLDPAGVAELRALLGELASRGVAVLLASHALTEVERLCRRAYFVRDGLVADIVDTAAGADDRLLVRASTSADLAALRSWAADQRLAAAAGADPLVLEFAVPDRVPELIRALAATGIDLEEIAPRRRSLENRFLELVGGRS